MPMLSGPWVATQCGLTLQQAASQQADWAQHTPLVEFPPWCYGVRPLHGWRRLELCFLAQAGHILQQRIDCKSLDWTAMQAGQAAQARLLPGNRLLMQRHLSGVGLGASSAARDVGHGGVSLTLHRGRA